MKRNLMVANWKMHTRAADAHILATSVRNGVASIQGIEVIICPPVIWLSELSAIVGRGGKVKLGAQNVYHETEGAFTGEVSPTMVSDLADYVILGHSERREYFDESDLDVNDKVIASLKAGLSPIICVGEKRKSSDFPEKVVEQVRAALDHVSKTALKNVVVAYEPVWAIGTGKEADPEYVARVITQLKSIIPKDVPVLYGGSTNSNNVEGFAKRPEIDGLLVGGASLRASEFNKMCLIWSSVKFHLV